VTCPIFAEEIDPAPVIAVGVRAETTSLIWSVENSKAVGDVLICTGNSVHMFAEVVDVAKPEANWLNRFGPVPRQ
jgi:hypothetical protein